MKKSLTALALLTWLGTASAGPVFANGYAQGVQDYQAGRFRQAVVKLARASGAQPTNSMIHYYLANALVKCGQHEEAAEEYRISYMLDPFGAVSGYCRTAIKGYKKSIPTTDDIKAFSNTMHGTIAMVASAVPRLPQLTQDAYQVLPDPLIADPSVRQAVSTIRRQVGYEKRKNETIGESHASSIMAQSESSARAVDSSARYEIEHLWSSHRHPRDPRLLDKMYLETREKEIRSNAKDEQERIRREARQKADRYRKVADMRQLSLDQVADNLARQMIEKPSNGGVRLVAEGTDLYVRRYASTSTNRAVPDVHAAVARITAKQTPADPSNNIEGSADGRAGQTELNSRSVRGKLID